MGMICENTSKKTEGLLNLLSKVKPVIKRVLTRFCTPIRFHFYIFDPIVIEYDNSALNQI